MSQILEKKAKKRKHSVAETVQDAEPSTKRAKKHNRKEDKSSKKAKGKARATNDGSEFRIVKASMMVSIPPVFANNPRAGVQDMLDSLLMRHIPALQGIVLAHDRLKFLDPVATIKADCPFANCGVSFDATVWSPQVGMKLVGQVKLCSPDHVALLVHRTFNVSIPRHHIPADQWEFEYGPAENDPEIRADVEPEADGVAEAGIEGVGRWLHKLTGAKLGGSDGNLEFTVVGLTIANQMLSLIGSIQPDPFAPELANAPAPGSHPLADSEPAGPPDGQLDLELDAGNESDEDAFSMLGRLGDEAAAREEQRAKESEAAKKDRKRKRKEGNGLGTNGNESKAARENGSHR